MKMMSKKNGVLLLATISLCCSGATWAEDDLPVQGVHPDTVKKAWAATNVEDLSPSARVQVKDSSQQKQVPENVSSEQKPLVNASVKSVSVNRSGLVSIRPGYNQAIPIALGQPNRLVTPFANPQVISTVLSGGRGKDCGEVCIRDSVVYITTNRTYPVTAFITEKGREDLAMSITMIPEAIPPREVTLTLPEEFMSKLRTQGKSSTKPDYAKAQAWETDQPYITSIKKTFRKLALGEVPSGYGLRAIGNREATPICRQDGLKFAFHPGQILEGSNMDFYVGVVKNVSNKPVEFLEQHCGGWRIAAVTSYPQKLLEPGQSTEVYIAVKHPDDISEESVRTPLIKRNLP